MTNSRSTKLLYVFSKIPLRTSKSALLRIIGEGSKVKGAIRILVDGFSSIPKQALKKWKNYLILLQNKQFFDGIRTQKLKNVLEKIPKKTMNEALLEIKNVKFGNVLVRKAFNRINQILGRLLITVLKISKF